MSSFAVVTWLDTRPFFTSSFLLTISQVHWGGRRCYMKFCQNLQTCKPMPWTFVDTRPPCALCRFVWSGAGGSTILQIVKLKSLMSSACLSNCNNCAEGHIYSVCPFSYLFCDTNTKSWKWIVAEVAEAAELRFRLNKETQHRDKTTKRTSSQTNM